MLQNARNRSLKKTDSPPENNQVLSPTSCVALGRIFGMTFPTVPPARTQVPVRSLRGVDQDLGARGGRAIRKVVPKILPRATQDVHFPPGGSGLRGGGRKFAPRDIYHNRVYTHNHVYDRRPHYEMLPIFLVAGCSELGYICRS